MHKKKKKKKKKKKSFFAMYQNYPLALKPQDSFGEFVLVSFSWSSESAGNHQKTPSDLPAIVLNDIV